MKPQPISLFASDELITTFAVEQVSEPLAIVPTVLSVSALNEAVKYQLETTYPAIWVSGEISNLSRPSSGHLYFSLKDSEAQVRCAFFKNYQARDLNLQNGDQVNVLAQVSLYPGRGDYQLIIKSFEKSGLGSLQQQFEILKKKLEQEGLFDARHKKKIPVYPKKIGLITSESGAALQDMLHVFERRYPIVKLLLFPSLVQGTEAPAQLIKMLILADQSTCDCLIIARGGGSLEDLWAFNDEALARTIFNLKTPIISGVGHEIDFTITDFVADVRAPTPSVAAEIATPDQSTLFKMFQNFEQRLSYAIQKQLTHHQHKLQHLSARLKHPKDKLYIQHQRLDILSMKLQELLRQTLKTQGIRVDRATERFQRIHPERRLQHLKQRLEMLSQQIKSSMRHFMEGKIHQLGLLVHQLNALNPLKLLERGFAITEQHGTVITSVHAIQVNEPLHTQLKDGMLISRVEKIIPKA